MGTAGDEALRRHTTERIGGPADAEPAVFGFVFSRDSMSWFADLSPYSYLRRPAESPAVNVGWLAGGHRFPTGDVPAELVPRLAMLIEHATTKVTRGLHDCEFCPPVADGQRVDSMRQGNAEIRAVGADGTRYAAPTLILHYVAVHRYAPPAAFVDAVLRPPPHEWEHALAHDLCFSCGDELERREQYRYGDGMLIVITCARCGVDYERIKPG